MQLNPYLTFNGQCESAIKFYEQILGGKITFTQTWGDSPMCENMPAEMHKLIMHATLSLGDSQLMCADSPPDRYEQPKGIHVTAFQGRGEGRGRVSEVVRWRSGRDAVSEDILESRLWNVRG